MCQSCNLFTLIGKTLTRPLFCFSSRLQLMEIALRQISALDSLKGLQGPYRDPRTQGFINTLKFPELDLIVVEWLLLQNPTKSFPPGSQPLPGQSYPGVCFEPW